MRLTTFQWITIIGSLITLTAGAFQTFPMKSDIYSRLDRIEAKLDSLIERDHTK